MDYHFLLELAILLFATKFLGVVAKRFGLPQVVGMLVAGILIGPAIWSPLTNGAFVPVRNSDIIKVLAEIGVIMIMFSAGLETDLKELKRSGLVATLIALAGVFVPLGLGFLIAVPFIGLDTMDNVLSCIFIGVMLTATSVSLTVATLRELGKLRSRVGTIILSAAIIDDVIGIIFLTFVIGIKNPVAGSPSYMIIINTIIFFVLAIGVGIGLNYLFKWLVKKYPHTRRVPIFAFVVCLVYSYVAEEIFSIAAITGAYLAGIILSTTTERDYMEKKIDINSYMLFSPIFFASIGINMSFSGFSSDILWFAMLYVLAGLLGKIVGCAIVARLCKFNMRDSLKIGAGMMARGEVSLIVAQKGISNKMIDTVFLTPVIILVLASSLLTPLIIKNLYKHDKTAVIEFESEDEMVDEAVSHAIE